MTAPMYLPRFFVRQKLTMMVNRYEIHESGPDGMPGRLMAVAQQKRMAFKEQVTFFRDEGRTQPVFSFAARQRMDLNAGYDVRDAGGDRLDLPAVVGGDLDAVGVGDDRLVGLLGGGVGRRDRADQ